MPKRSTLLPSKGELRILQILWQLNQATVEDVVSAYKSWRKPNYKTTQTLLRIMEEKGFISHFNRGRVFVFVPLVNREEIGRSTVRELLKDTFGGSPAELLVNLIEGMTIKEQELDELEHIIKTYRGKTRAAK